MNKNIISYPIERETFCKIVEGTISSDLLFDLIDSNYESEEFKIWKNDEEIYLFHYESFTLINYYKTYHLGRCLNANITHCQDFFNFFTLLLIDYKENNNKNN